MGREGLRAIRNRFVVNLYAPQIEALVNGPVHNGIGAWERSLLLRPRQMKEEISHGAKSCHDLVVLETIWISPKGKYARVVLDAARNDAGPFEHPVERDIREPRFILRIASADVGMVAAKPNLLKPLNLAFIARGFLRAEPRAESFSCSRRLRSHAGRNRHSDLDRNRRTSSTAR